MALIRVGLQPTLAAGCMVQIASRQYDISLRRRFAETKPRLVERIRQLNGGAS
jgi:hypothetical protein